MTAKILAASDPAAIKRAADVLRADGIVAYPTDTVYGLGANVFSPEALDKVMDAKQRPDEKSLPVLIGNRSHLRELVQSVPPSAGKLIEAFWPGALTIVLAEARGPLTAVGRDDARGAAAKSHRNSSPACSGRLSHNRHQRQPERQATRNHGPRSSTSTRRRRRPDSRRRAGARQYTFHRD